MGGIRIQRLGGQYWGLSLGLVQEVDHFDDGVYGMAIQGLTGLESPYSLTFAGDLNGEGYGDVVMSDRTNDLSYGIYGYRREPVVQRRPEPLGRGRLRHLSLPHGCPRRLHGGERLRHPDGRRARGSGVRRVAASRLVRSIDVSLQLAIVPGKNTEGRQ